MKYYSDMDSNTYAIACALPGEDDKEIRNLYPVSDVNLPFSFFPQPQVHIEDPLNPANNVGKSSYQFHQIRVSQITYSPNFSQSLE